MSNNNPLHGYGPPKKRKLPEIPGIQVYCPRTPRELDWRAGFTLLRVNGGYAVKQHYPDLKPNEINFILR